jgi:hypothetical protein
VCVCVCVRTRVLLVLITGYIEQVFGKLKAKFDVLRTDFRRPICYFNNTFQVCCALWNIELNAIDDDDDEYVENHEVFQWVCNAADSEGEQEHPEDQEDLASDEEYDGPRSALASAMMRQRQSGARPNVPVARTPQRVYQQVDSSTEDEDDEDDVVLGPTSTDEEADEPGDVIPPRTDSITVDARMEISTPPSSTSSSKKRRRESSHTLTLHQEYQNIVQYPITTKRRRTPRVLSDSE